MALNTIRMNDYETLEAFRDACLQAARDGKTPIVLWEDQYLFAACSPESTRDAICREVVDRIVDNPDILSDLQQRVENEEPEDWN